MRAPTYHWRVFEGRTRGLEALPKTLCAVRNLQIWKDEGYVDEGLCFALIGVIAVASAQHGQQQIVVHLMLLYLIPRPPISMDVPVEPLPPGG